MTKAVDWDVKPQTKHTNTDYFSLLAIHRLHEHTVVLVEK